jgi:DNA-binding beta-propeller fold protein YncE
MMVDATENYMKTRCFLFLYHATVSRVKHSWDSPRAPYSIGTDLQTCVAPRCANEYDDRAMTNQARLAMPALILSFLFASGCSQLSAPAHAQNSTPAPLQFVSEWGTKGDDPGQLDDPQSIAVDPVGNVYIANAGSGFIEKFSSDGIPLLAFQESRLKQPQSIAVDDGEAMYITDPARSTIYVVFPKSEHDVHRILRLRTRPSSENSLSVAVDDEGMIYVLDQDAGKVFTFSPRLRLWRSWIPSPGPLRVAYRKKKATTVGPVHVGGDGNVYVADPDANRLLRFDHLGRFQGDVPSRPAKMATVAESSAAAPANGGSADVPPRPSGDAISDQFAVSHNYIFVMDANGNTLHVWNMDGSPKLDVDLADKLGPTQHSVSALALSRDGKTLYVLDSANCRVLRYRVNF